MRILVVNDFCSRNGGAASVAIDSALGLAEAGHDVRFVGITGPVAPALTNKPSIAVYCANEPTFLDDTARLGAAMRGWWNPRARLHLEAALKDWRGSQAVIHVHGWVKAFSPSIFPVLWSEPKWRVVITLHDYFLACPNGGFMDYPSTEICTRRALSLSCLACNCDSRSYSQKLWRFGRGVIQTHFLRVAQNAHGVIGVSDFALDKMRSYLGSKVIKRVVRNPVTASQPARSGSNPNGPLLFVGRLSPEKGVELALQAARSIGRKLLIVGEGPDGNRLRQMYPEADFVGWVSSEAVAEHMRNSSALIFPSRWYETNGLVVLEAMAQGLPVIIAEGTAPTEFVKDGETGLRFRMGDRIDLERKIQTILGPDGVRLAANAAEWYWSNPWTSEKHVKALVDLYTEVLDD